MTKRLLMLLVASLVLVVACAPSPGATSPKAPAPTAGVTATQKEAWQIEWDKTVQAARAEGKLTIYGDLSVDESQAIIKNMAAQYGVTVELVAGKAAEIAQKTLSERNAGLFIPDINMSGVVGSIVLLKPRGVTEKMDTALILPDVKNPAIWLNGVFPWVDSDHTQIQFIGEVFPGILVNTQAVPPGEIKSYQDLLNPKWKGKMVLADPTTPSSGSQWFSKMTLVLGEDYMRSIVKQAPVISRNDRLSVEWVAQNKYPVGVALQSAQIWKFIAEGAPVAVVDTEVGALSPGHGCISLMKNAPHPNAAKVFINWMLTKEGQTAFSKGAFSASRRTDVETSWVAPAAVPKAGRKYIEDDDASLAKRNDMADLAKVIFEPLLKG